METPGTFLLLNATNFACSFYLYYRSVAQFKWSSRAFLRRESKGASVAVEVTIFYRT
jgi:hypothetical protein